MDKKEACHRLAEINEEIYECEKSLADIASRLCWEDEDRKEWYEERKEEMLIKLAKCKEEHDTFISEYHDIIYS